MCEYQPPDQPHLTISDYLPSPCSGLESPSPTRQVNPSQIVIPPAVVAKDCLVTPNLLPKLAVKEHPICPTFNVIISTIVCTTLTLSQGSAGFRPPIILSCFDGKHLPRACCCLPHELSVISTPPCWRESVVTARTWGPVHCHFQGSHVQTCWSKWDPDLTVRPAGEGRAGLGVQAPTPRGAGARWRAVTKTLIIRGRACELWLLNTHHG